MSKLINGSFAFNYASIVGGSGMTSDQVTDTGTGNTLSYDIAYLENNSGGSSLSGNITIGTTGANTITVNSGQTTYNNAEIIKVKDNVAASIRLQCNDAGPTDLMILNTTNGAESMYLPLTYTEIGNVASGGVQIGDGTNAGATNLYGIVSLKNATDSTTYSSTNCSNVAGGLSVYKKLNVGGNIVTSGSIASGNATIRIGSNLRNMLEYDVTNDITYIDAGASVQKIGISSALNSFYSSNNTGFLNTVDAGSATSTTSSVYCAGGMAIAKKLYVGTGLFLPTTTGTATILNYYEEASSALALAPSGGGAYVFNGVAYYTRVGKIISMRIPVFTGDTLGGYMTATGAVPTRFRPITNVSYGIPVSISNGTSGIAQSYMGELLITTAGTVQIYSTYGGTGLFTSGAGSGIINDVTVTWTMY